MCFSVKRGFQEVRAESCVSWIEIKEQQVVTNVDGLGKLNKNHPK